MSFFSEVLVVGGVAMDLVGAVVLAHAHNAESVVELREEIGSEGRALGEEDSAATHAQLLSEKRVGFFVMAFGLALYLSGLVVGSPEGAGRMALIALGVVAAGLILTTLWVRLGGRRVRRQVHEAMNEQDPQRLPEQ